MSDDRSDTATLAKNEKNTPGCEDGDTISGQAASNKEDRAQEEENRSELPGDPRPNTEKQPPFKEQY